MKQIIASLCAAVALAAKSEVFTLALMIVGAGWLIAALAKGCQSRRANDVWAVDWEVQ